MPNARISLPTSTAIDQIFPFAIELDRYSQHDRLIIDLPESTFFSPFVMLFLGKKIAHLRSKCPQLQVMFNGWERHPYASHMGFFDLCGYVHGKHVGEAWGSRQYLPITRLKRDDLIEKEIDKYEEIQDLVQRRVDKIAEIVARDTERRGIFFNVLSFSVREVFRNVFEHGETDELYYCAQYWPKSDKVEFAVADAGVGIRRSLGHNPNFRFGSDKAALEAALLPSVSGKTHQPRRSANWYNSGYGLYMINRLARNGGSFVIASGESAICLTPRTKTNFTTSFSGSILRVSFKVSEIGDVQQRLAEFRKDGAKIAAQIKGSGNRPPSAMSMLLRRDYR
jgi:hypothetical protein